MRDTTGDALDRYHQLLKSQAPHQRLGQAVALTRAVRTLAVAGIRQRHPSASDDEVRARLAVRLYGREAVSHIFGDLPDDAV